jgi:hypothetical protein
MSGIDVRPEPVLDEAKIVAKVTGLLTGAGTIATVLGLASVADTSTIVIVLTAVLGAGITAVNSILPIVRARIARDQVTPVGDPVSITGVRLVEETAS